MSIKSLRRAIFCDLATSEKSRADYTVIATVGADDQGNVYILDIRRGRWEWPEAKSEIISEITKQGVDLVGVETNGFQLSGFQELIREESLGGVSFFPVKQDKDKFSRALLVSSKAANGKLFMRKGAPWKKVLIYEFETFPGKHDDIVDAITGAVELLFSDNRTTETASPIVIHKKPTGIKRRRRRYG